MLDSEKKAAYNTLARFMISTGKIPKKFTKKHFYNFFSPIMHVTLPKHKQTLWLCRLATIIEKNQHREFNILAYRDVSILGLYDNK